MNNNMCKNLAYFHVIDVIFLRLLRGNFYAANFTTFSLLRGALISVPHVKVLAFTSITYEYFYVEILPRIRRNREMYELPLLCINFDKFYLKHRKFIINLFIINIYVKFIDPFTNNEYFNTITI